MNKRMNRLTLEKYKGRGSRFTCPACGRAKKFSRYIDSETGRYIADHVGRCDRETSCGYHLKPKEYFADNPTPGCWTLENLRKPKNHGILAPGLNRANGLERGSEARFQSRKPDYLDNGHLFDTLRNYNQNSFVQFLLGLFPFDPEDVNEAVKDYLIGTKDGFVVFPIISKIGKFCKAQLMKFDPATGNRLKEDYSISSLQSKLKRAGDLKEDFETDKDVFFGEHLLSKCDRRPIAIVEAPKTAVIASICKGVFPDMVWLACGGKSNLNVERLTRLGHDQRFILFPDADGFDKWQSIASDARKQGLTVNVSDLIERRATDAEKAEGFDLADYLIREQARRTDPASREAFRDLIEERLAILTIDGDMNEEQAEAEIIASGFYQNAIRSVLDQSANLGNIVHTFRHLSCLNFFQIDCSDADKDRADDHKNAKNETEPSRSALAISDKSDLENFDTFVNEIDTEKPNYNLQKAYH